MLDLNDIVGLLTLFVTCIPGAWFLIRIKQQRQRNLTNMSSSANWDLVSKFVFKSRSSSLQRVFFQVFSTFMVANFSML